MLGLTAVKELAERKLSTVVVAHSELSATAGLLVSPYFLC